jgi:predicted esterase/tetratricopeptide (TPR) repeat protein
MIRRNTSRWRSVLAQVAIAGAAVSLAMSLVVGAAWATEIVLKDGRVLHGKAIDIPGLAEDPLAPKAADALRRIALIDDDLRRTFVSKQQLASSGQHPSPNLENIKLRQSVAVSGNRVGTVGAMYDVTEFDDWGRRRVKMQTNKGPIDIVQGITEITPVWTKVEGLNSTIGQAYVWDMRIGTNSIPRETLHRILLNPKTFDTKKPDHWVRVVKLYMQAERFKEAEAELEQLVAALPDFEGGKSTLQLLRQLTAQRILQEIEVRRTAGQHGLVETLLKNFPSDNVTGETLQRVREKAQEYEQLQQRYDETIKKLEEYVAGIDNQGLKDRLQPIVKQLAEELNYDTLDRMTAFRQSFDKKLAPIQKISLAISGWLMGSDQATDQPNVALALLDVRSVLREYLSTPSQATRDQLLSRLRSEEAFTPKIVAQLADLMKPPLDLPEDNNEGLYQLTVPGPDNEPNITYFVQLPPEYDPYRRYPTIITLHGSNTNPKQQIDWWAGAPTDKGLRAGQATRQGYIVIAPAWTQSQQTEYKFSAKEHAAVLNTLRDACRRFSIDTDRVYLSGHSLGGNAAWDIGLAHPDLWAGVIPIVAAMERDSLVSFYTHNAYYVPFYFVSGEMDGDKMVKNSINLDRYLNFGYDTTVVEFQGQGHEDFSDEIQRIFDWMGRKQRNFFPRKIDCRTLRSTDNFFWWLEVAQFPPKAIIGPKHWPPPAGTRATSVGAMLTAENGVNVATSTAQYVVWLSPEMVDFSRPVNVSMNGKTKRFAGPDLSVLLEDLRTRGDRRHPFWGKVE